jgi:hypothetical protein
VQKGKWWKDWKGSKMGFVTCDPENQFVLFLLPVFSRKTLRKGRSVFRIFIYFFANI